MKINEVVLSDGEKRYELYLNIRGKQVRNRFKTKREAERRGKQIETELRTNAGKSKNYTWDRWFEFFLEMISVTHRRSTILNYQKVFEKHTKLWTDKLIATIGPADVRHLIENAPVSQMSRKNLLKMLKVVFQMAIGENILIQNPCIGINIRVPEPVKTILNSEEINTLLRESHRRNHRWYKNWALALMTGCRTGELYALRWTDIDFFSDRISITKSWSRINGEGPTKSSYNRIVPISRELKTLLTEMKLKKTDEFVLPRIEEWTNGRQAEVLRNFCQAIGITSVKFHDLRACFITSMLLAGVSVPLVMKIVGHADLETTMKYVRLIAADLNGATDKLTYIIPRQTENAKILNFIRQ